MPVSHARATTVTSTEEDGEEAPGLLEVLARVADPRKKRGQRYRLVFMLAVTVACALAGAKNFRELGDQARDLPQEILARLGGRPHPLHRKIIAPSEKRLRTVIHGIGADDLDELIGGWLRALADAGRLEHLLTAIAIDGKWLRGVADGQVKLFAALLHEDGVIIAQHRILDDTTETTQVRELLDPVDLDGAVVTADAAHAQRETAEYIAGSKDDENRETDYFLLSSRATSPACSAPSTTPSSTTDRASRTTSSWTTATAASSSAPSGSPAPTASTSRTPPKSRGSAATATTSPAR